MNLSKKTVSAAINGLAIVLLCGVAASAQSGRALMKGYVAFKDIAYVAKQPRARVELCSSQNSKKCEVAVETDEHGLFEINPAPLGEWWLRISAPGFVTYEINIYLPSDFIGNLAVLMKSAGEKKMSSRAKVGSRTRARESS